MASRICLMNDNMPKVYHLFKSFIVSSVDQCIQISVLENIAIFLGNHVIVFSRRTEEIFFKLSMAILPSKYGPTDHVFSLLT